MIDVLKPAHELTYKQFKEQEAQAYAKESGLTVTEVRDAQGDNLWDVWRDAVQRAVFKGYEPTQAWINAAREQNPEWWERRIVHDNPVWVDRMTRAGFALLTTKTNLLSPRENLT